ncbi:MAG: hypothetical protein K6U74_10555 [Firmicutes bacterium]|nr:hypothetical protein [Bacillota bacterium]
MRYEHPDPAFSAVVTELIRSTSRVKPLERRLRAIDEKAREFPGDPDMNRRAALHACLALTKRKVEEPRRKRRSQI